MEATERRKRLDALAGEPDPARRTEISVDGLTELDWGYLESTVASVAQDAAALAELRREATA